MLIGTFMVQNRDTPGIFFLGDYNNYYLSHKQMQNTDLQVQLLEIVYLLVNLLILTKLNILYVMELQENNVDGE